MLYRILPCVLPALLLLGCYSRSREQPVCHQPTEECTLVKTDSRIISVPVSKWNPMDNPESFAVNFESRTLTARHKYNQVVTIYLNPMSPDRITGERLSSNEYVELFWLGSYPGLPCGPGPDPGYLVAQVRVDKGDYWLLSRESFVIPNISVDEGAKLNQKTFDYNSARMLFPEIQEAIDSTRLLLRREF